MRYTNSDSKTRREPSSLEKPFEAAPSLMGVFLKERKQAFTVPKVGDLVGGKMLRRAKNALYVDIGSFGVGVIYGKEFYDALKSIKNLNVGDEVITKVVEQDNDDGWVELSLHQAGRELSWEDLKEKKAKGIEFEVAIKNSNKGGLIAEVHGIDAFLPVSQLSQKHYPRVEGGDKTKIVQELRKLVGEKLNVKIIDLSPQEEKVILSEKVAVSEDLKKILERYAVGETVEGVVTGVVPFGAFVSFPASEGGDDGASQEQLEGLIHISELDWQIIDDPSKIVNVGERVKAKIIGIENGRISLSLKALKKDPWKDVEKAYKKWDIVQGKITKFNPFGAFVELAHSIQGLIHISEFGSEKRMRESLALGEEYSFKILLVEPESHRLALSLVREDQRQETPI